MGYMKKQGDVAQKNKSNQINLNEREAYKLPDRELK